MNNTSMIPPAESTEEQSRRRCPITVIIPTFNEEANLPCALQSVSGWADQIIIIDSGSTDQTVEIAKSFKEIEVFHHPYENMAAQRMWGLALPSIKHEWVLNLDADEQVTPELKNEIKSILPMTSLEISGFMLRRKHIFMGRWMKHGGDYIWLVRLVRLNKCRIIKTPIVNEHTIINGKVEKLQSHLIHETQKSLTEWMQRVNKGAQKFVLGIYDHSGRLSAPQLKKGERVEGSIRTFLNYYLYAKTPLILRPFIRFTLFYFIRGGFLDGCQGFVYHVINDFVYPFLVWAKYKELSKNQQALHEAKAAKWR